MVARCWGCERVPPPCQHREQCKAMAAGMEDLTGVRINAWSVSEQSRQQISVGVVDDQRLFRESIAGMLAAESFISVVGVACNGLEAIELVRQFRPAVMLMDVKMPEMNGIRAARQIKAEFPETKIILLTTFTSDDFVLEDISAVGLVSAIRAVNSGEQVTAPDIANRVMQLLEKQNPDKGQHENGLTAREMQMIELIARGMVAKEIARLLAISEKTVRNHISSIYRKLEIYDRSQVVIYAMKKGLIDIDEGS